MTSCILSMVTGWPPVRRLLYKPAKVLAPNTYSVERSETIFEPALIQLSIFQKKKDFQKKNIEGQSILICEFVFFMLLATSVVHIFIILLTNFLW